MPKAATNTRPAAAPRAQTKLSAEPEQQAAERLDRLGEELVVRERRRRGERRQAAAAAAVRAADGGRES